MNLQLIIKFKLLLILGLLVKVLDDAVKISFKAITFEESLNVWSFLFGKIDNMEMIFSFLEFGHESLS